MYRWFYNLVNWFTRKYRNYSQNDLLSIVQAKAV